MPNLPKTAQETISKRQDILEIIKQLSSLQNAIERHGQARHELQEIYDYSNNIVSVVKAASAALDEYAAVLQTVLDTTPVTWANEHSNE